MLTPQYKYDIVYLSPGSPKFYVAHVRRVCFANVRWLPYCLHGSSCADIESNIVRVEHTFTPVHVLKNRRLHPPNLYDLILDFSYG